MFLAPAGGILRGVAGLRASFDQPVVLLDYCRLVARSCGIAKNALPSMPVMERRRVTLEIRSTFSGFHRRRPERQHRAHC